MIDENKLIERLEEFIEYDCFDEYHEEPLIIMSFEKLEDIILSEAKNSKFIDAEKLIERIKEEPKCGLTNEEVVDIVKGQMDEVKKDG